MFKMEETKITFAVGYTSERFMSHQFQLLEYDTVDQLKIEIHRAFEIPPHKQILEGWKEVPDNDQMILQFCCDLNRINYLTVKHMDLENKKAFGEDGTEDNKDSPEIKATKSCYKKICSHMVTSHIKFNFVSLKYAIENHLSVNPNQRKVILLYLHNSEDDFSYIFLRKIKKPEISDLLKKSFIVLGWDLENEGYHSSLNEALTKAGLEHLSSLIDTKTCASIVLQNINGTIRALSFLMEDKSEGTNDTFLACLKNSHDFLTVDRIHAESDNSENNYELDAENFQKLMADMLGDRDYDRFSPDQHQLLKDKICYALFGQPTEEKGYSEKQYKRINLIFVNILKHNNKFAEYKNEIEISFIYNVTEPLEKEKESRARENPKYNPKTDILPVPIFVLRKCKNSKRPCRIFVDDIGRVYDTWQSYIEDNKLHKCKMVLPKDGRYEVIADKVLLETHASPACAMSKKFLKGGDIATSIGGIGSGAVLLTAGIASIPVAPIAVAGAVVAGGIAGVYGFVRSSVSLADRIKHDEELSPINSEARAIYFNIVAGALGFVGAGANFAVSQLAARGFNIGQGINVTVNTVGVANLGVSGASIINSGYDVYDQWINNNQTPSLLTVVQLSSSILFFGNAVYNFKSCQTIIEESQTQALQEIQDSLRSNRHRKTFDKLTKETLRQNDGNQIQGRAEVIKTIRNMQNKDEIFASLTRNNKLMNKRGIRFSASDGEISFNGQTVNMNDLSALNQKNADSFLSNLPMEKTISPSQTKSFISDFSLNRLRLPNVDEFAVHALRLISAFGTDVQGLLMHLAETVIEASMSFFRDLLDELFPNNGAYAQIFQKVVEYFGCKATDYLRKYNMWRQTGNPHYYQTDFIDVPVGKTDQVIWIFSKVVKIFCSGGNVSGNDIKDIIKYVETWIFKTYSDETYSQEENIKKEKERLKSPKRKSNKCLICGGEYKSE